MNIILNSIVLSIGSAMGLCYYNYVMNVILYMYTANNIYNYIVYRLCAIVVSKHLFTSDFAISNPYRPRTYPV